MRVVPIRIGRNLWWALLIGVVLVDSAWGQVAPRGFLEDEIETDRDSFTPAVTTADPGRWIIESSYSFADNRTGAEGHSFPELLARGGLNNWLEVRLGWNYEVGKDSSAFSDFELGGEEAGNKTEARVLYGMKALTSRQAGWVPQTALIVQGFTPTAGAVNDSHFTVGEVLGWKFGERWQWDSSVRYGDLSEREDHFSVWAGSSVIKVFVHEKWNVHLEYFCVASDGKEREFARHFISPGFHVLLSRNLEIGTRFGFGLNEQSARFFNNVGVGWRY